MSLSTVNCGFLVNLSFGRAPPFSSDRPTVAATIAIAFSVGTTVAAVALAAATAAAAAAAAAAVLPATPSVGVTPVSVVVAALAGGGGGGAERVGMMVDCFESSADVRDYSVGE